MLDGRDIGTVIAPDAPAKLFVTASPEVRADRRWRQLRARGESGRRCEEILADIRRRDERDSRPRQPRRCARRPTPSCWTPLKWL